MKMDLTNFSSRDPRFLAVSYTTETSTLFTVSLCYANGIECKPCTNNCNVQPEPCFPAQCTCPGVLSNLGCDQQCQPPRMMEACQAMGMGRKRRAVQLEGKELERIEPSRPER